MDVCSSLCDAGQRGWRPGELTFPKSGVSGSGDVYVADLFNDRVDEFWRQGFSGGVRKEVGGRRGRLHQPRALWVAWVAARASSIPR